MEVEDQPDRWFIPWPLSLVADRPRPGLTLGFAASALMVLAMWLMGAYDPDSTSPYWATTPGQVISLAIAYPVLIGYLSGVAAFTHVRSIERLNQLAPILMPDAAPVAGRLGRVSRGGLWAATALGLLVAAFNVDFRTVLGLRDGVVATGTDYAMTFGSLVTWLVSVRLSYLFLHNARLFGVLGEHHTQIDLYRPLTRRPFAQTATLYLLAVMGALAITPLQALDAILRVENFSWAFAIGVPVAATLPFLTMRGVRKATLIAKRAELDRLDGEIATASRTLNPAALQQLNALIERRDYVADQHGWPMDIRIVSRAAFYVIIPPLAWVGAALVELAIDALLTGS